MKVSLFLQDGIQNSDGSFRIECKGHVGVGTEVPGIVRYYNDKGETTKADMLSLSSAEGVLDESKADPMDPKKRPCKLGVNLYAVNRDNKPAQGGSKQRAADAAPTPAPAAEPAAAKVQEEAPPPIEAVAPKSGGGKKGLNMLANIMGTPNLYDPETRQLHASAFTQFATVGSCPASDNIRCFELVCCVVTATLACLAVCRYERGRGGGGQRTDED